MNVAELQQLISSKTADDPHAAIEIVDSLLAASALAGASDLHLRPTSDGLALAWRIDGVLQPVGRVPQQLAGNVVGRMKVLARLLTYRTGVPQEGRIAGGDSAVEVRVSTFPTLFGEKVVCRNLPRGDRPLTRLAELGLPARVESALQQALRQTSGAIVIAGPAGSGKTTTAYASLREIMRTSGGQRSVSTLEDPVEAVVEGAAQSQVAAEAGFDLLTGLRSLVRQDPEVVLIGEIRDAEVAAVAMQAALTGQLVLTTFHATDAAAAVSRLREIGVMPYALRSGVRMVIAQRLLRRLCRCAEFDPSATQVLGEEAPTGEARRAAGCNACRGTGYFGRLAVAEMVDVDAPNVARLVLAGADAATLREAVTASGAQSLAACAKGLVADGVTSVAEVVRVFGLPLAIG